MKYRDKINVENFNFVTKQVGHLTCLLLYQLRRFLNFNSSQMDCTDMLVPFINIPK